MSEEPKDDTTTAQAQAVRVPAQSLATTGAPGQPGMPGPGQPGAPQPGQPGAPPSGQAAPLSPSEMQALQTAITRLAAKEAPGMHPYCPTFGAHFVDGQTLEQPFTLQPKMTYAVIGVGRGITELDLTIAAQMAPNLTPTVLAQDTSAGPTAVIGGQGHAFVNPLPVSSPAKVVMRVRGQGMAAAQIYVK